MTSHAHAQGYPSEEGMLSRVTLGDTCSLCTLC